MKRLFMIVLVLQSFALFVKGQTVEQANNAYETGNYSAAIGLYESVIAQGERSGEIYFNLGNAYYLNGQPGQALLNYRRAESYLPRDTIIAERIALVRSERVDGITPETDWLVISANITADYLTLTETGAMVLVIWILFFVILAIGMRRRQWLVLISVFGVVTVVAVGLLMARVFVETRQPSVVVITECVQAMSGPSDSYLPLFTVFEASELRAIETRDGWVRVALADGRQGWIRAATIGHVQNE